jgi:hypothetical protein
MNLRTQCQSRELMEPNWEAKRRELIAANVQGLLAGGAYKKHTPQAVVGLALKHADLTIALLKACYDSGR